MDDLYTTFDEKDKQYIELKLNKVKLSSEDLTAKFGEEKARLLLINDDIKRYLIDKELEKQKLKNIVGQLRVDKYLSLLPRALEVLNNALDSPNETESLKAALSILKPVASYIEKAAISSAQLDALGSGELEFKFNYSLKNDE